MISPKQISRIAVFQVDLPFAGGTYRLSGGREYTSFDATFVQVTTDDGIEGWGESTPFGSNYVAAHARGVRAGIDEMAPQTVALRRQVDVPIVLDELADSGGSLIQMVADNAGDGVGLKVTKNGGLTQCRRHRDIALAAGFTMSVQDTVGSEIAFAAVVHLGQTVPTRSLRCVLDVRAMVTQQTATFDAPIVDAGVRGPNVPGLGVTPDLDVLGPPVASYS